jgi:hypothetical protein
VRLEGYIVIALKCSIVKFIFRFFSLAVSSKIIKWREILETQINNINFNEN